MRRTLILLMALALLVVGVSSSASAASGPPDRHEETFPILFPDLENGKVVFINTTRDIICTAEQIAFEEWILDGANGVPPEGGFQFEGIDPIAIQEKMVGDGVIVGLAKGSNLHTELWELDDPADRPGVGPCTDTDDKMEKFAEGTSRYQGNNNDLFGSDTRGHAFGERGVASLTGADGESYTYTHRFHLNSRCYVPEFGPEACLLDSASLR
jgi:hypothetical protein